jgi:hypothetical protein
MSDSFSVADLPQLPTVTYVWGDNTFGQCGFTNTSQHQKLTMTLPLIIDRLGTKNIEQVSAGLLLLMMMMSFIRL